MAHSGKTGTPIGPASAGLSFEVIMKYRVTQPFIAFGKTPQPGEIVELTPEQADLLAGNDCITEYETKVQPLPENKSKKKPRQSRSAPAAPASRKKTVRKPAKSRKK